MPFARIGHSRWLRDLAVALRFFSRLPVPQGADAHPHAMPSLAGIATAVPLAGAVIGLLGALAMGLGMLLHLGPFVAAALGVTALVLVTGALHEDGLADTADGFGGGWDRTRRLAIMRDSRIGSYGTVALVLSLLLRVAALHTLLVQVGVVRAAFALVAAAAASRAAGILLVCALPPAREDGAGAAAGRPGADAAFACGLSAALLVALLLVPTFGVGATFAGLIAPALVLLGAIALARRLIGGQTGDVAGATQQVAEIAFLLGVLIFARAP